MVDISETVLFAARVSAAVRAFVGDGPEDPDTGIRMVRALIAAEAVTSPPPEPEARLPRAQAFDVLGVPAA